MRHLPLVGLLAFATACSSDPSGPPLAVSVAPLTLPGLTDVCYDLKVTNAPNGSGDTVWQRSAVCATQFGDGIGDITYIGTCDAGDAGTSGQINTVVLSIADLWTTGNHTTAPNGYVDRDTYQNPCGSPSNDDGFAPCTLEVPCFENQDAAVEFNLTVLRDAGQGFFDIAVNFEDVFCSAKFDCGEPSLDLLFAADGERHDTAVLGFACTAGPGAGPTHLYMNDLVIACDDVVVATLDPSVNDLADPGPGNQLDPAGTVVDPGNDIVFQWAVYQGQEALGQNAVPPFDKSYWNVAIGFDVEDLAGRECTLTTSATASAGAFTPPGTTPVGAVYPRIVWDVPLNAGAAALTCGSNALDASTDGPVRTDYVNVPTCFGNHGSVPQAGTFTSVANACTGVVTDCREPGGPVCNAPLACDYLSGTCVDSSLACVLNGTPVTCGTTWRCGPGSTCNAQSNTCVATSQCESVLCDATGTCRGATCTFDTGGITDVTVTVPPTTLAGAANGFDATATVSAETLCGLNVSFEVIQDVALFTTVARGTNKLLRIPLDTGTLEDYVTTPEPQGLAADREGTLYWVGGPQILTTRTDSGAPDVTVFSAATNAIRLSFGPDGVLYGINYNGDLLRFDPITGVQSTVAPSIGYIGTGITFNAAGQILLGSGHQGDSSTVTVNRYNVATGLLEFYARWDFGFDIYIPFIEGMSLSPDGRVYAGFFPNQGPYGALIRIDEVGTPSIAVVLDVPQMQADLPGVVRGAGIHGVAFGIDGSLYFANQNNTGGDDSSESQILRLSGDPVGGPLGTVSLVATVPNFDYALGFDGDLVMQTKTIESGTASVNQSGVATFHLASPTVRGVYAVRVLVSDPRQGTVYRAQKVFEVQ